MIEAYVKRVIDGDTLEVEIKTMRVRMDFIDAPETKGVEREAGLKSKEYLKKLEGKSVNLDVKKTDMYDRFLCVVYQDNVNINAELVKKGFAELYSPVNHNNGIID